MTVHNVRCPMMIWLSPVYAPSRDCCAGSGSSLAPPAAASCAMGCSGHGESSDALESARRGTCGVSSSACVLSCADRLAGQASLKLSIAPHNHDAALMWLLCVACSLRSAQLAGGGTVWFGQGYGCDLVRGVPTALISEDKNARNWLEPSTAGNLQVAQC